MHLLRFVVNPYPTTLSEFLHNTHRPKPSKKGPFFPPSWTANTQNCRPQPRPPALPLTPTRYPTATSAHPPRPKSTPANGKLQNSIRAQKCTFGDQRNSFHNNHLPTTPRNLCTPHPRVPTHHTKTDDVSPTAKTPYDITPNPLSSRFLLGRRTPPAWRTNADRQPQIAPANQALAAHSPRHEPHGTG